MSQKEIYCTGRAEYLAKYDGYSLTEGYQVAESEWERKEEELFYRQIALSFGGGRIKWETMNI